MTDPEWATDEAREIIERMEVLPPPQQARIVQRFERAQTETATIAEREMLGLLALKARNPLMAAIAARAIIDDLLYSFGCEGVAESWHSVDGRAHRGPAPGHGFTKRMPK